MKIPNVKKAVPFRLLAGRYMPKTDLKITQLEKKKQ